MVLFYHTKLLKYIADFTIFISNITLFGRRERRFWYMWKK